MTTAKTARGFLSRFRKDTRGNTLAIMAASLIPLAGMVGGGIDLSRLYIVKTRLQHACDAGALAGRKAMGGGIWAQTATPTPNNVANTFFDGNFIQNSYGSTNSTRAFTENGGEVTGTASAVVPMTLMKIFGKSNVTLTVTCDADMRLPNTDVMFVLDNTGSMGNTLPGDTQTKIAALRTAVKCFYEIVARQPTNAACANSAPTGGLDSDVQVRFGFVPFDTNVRVGRLLPTEYFANTWNYQSRRAATLYGTFASWNGTNTKNAGSWSGWTNTSTSVAANSQSQCNSKINPPSDTYAITPNATGAWPVQGTESTSGWQAYINTTQTTYQAFYVSSTNTCWLQQETRSIDRLANWNRATSATANKVNFPAWEYNSVPLNISGLKATATGVNWNSGVSLPIGSNYANITVPWDGCIEERTTVRQTSYDPIPAGAHDLDIDAVPSQSDPNSLWAPALPDAIQPRKDGYTGGGNTSYNPVTNFYQSGYSLSSGSYSCPAAAHKMEVWSDPAAFDTYVDSLVPGSNTYHDIGLLWGARLMSPTGIFSTENALTQSGGEIQRHLIFMTDGDACTSNTNYQAYGIAWYDRRQTDPSAVPSDGCTDGVSPVGTLTAQVNARSAALCTAIKNKNITLWVIYFGTTGSGVATQMQNCASPGRFYAATNSTALQSAFTSIANQISQLRLTQ